MLDGKIFMESDEIIFRRVEDEHVRNLVLYATADEKHLTLDKKGTKKITKEDLMELLMRGYVIISLDNEYLIPTKFSNDGSYVTVKCYGDGTAKTFYSKEKSID